MQSNDSFGLKLKNELAVFFLMMMIVVKDHKRLGNQNKWNKKTIFRDLVIQV